MKIKLLARCIGVYLSFLFILVPVLCHADEGALTSVRVYPATDYTRVIFKIASPNKYHIFLLPNPNRLVVDFENTHLTADIKNLNFNGSILNNARRGWPAPFTLRIVFDMSGSARIKHFWSAENNEAQLVVDVYPKEKLPALPAPVVSKAEQVFVEMGSNDLRKLPALVQPAPAAVTANVTNPQKKLKLQIVEPTKPRPLVVVVDAGHGGKDPGTIGMHGTQEKDVVLAIALRLAELINQDPRLQASLTRQGDYFVTLKGRLQLARKDKADLFMSIHADSYFNDHSIGASVYALSQHGASSMAARWLADRENHSELGGVDLNGLGDHSYLLRSVLIDLAQTATIMDSVRLGTDMLSALQSVTSLHYARVEQAPFMVLKSPDIPSILVETGFLSNPEEEERLRDPFYRDKLARALLEGVRQYVATHPMMANNAKPQSSEEVINNRV